jgi:hypothetical protein
VWYSLEYSKTRTTSYSYWVGINKPSDGERARPVTRSAVPELHRTTGRGQMSRTEVQLTVS